MSFYADYLTDFSCSSEIELVWSEDDKRDKELTWDEQQIPQLYTPINNMELLKNKRLVMIVWYMDVLTGSFTVIG